MDVRLKFRFLERASSLITTVCFRLSSFNVVAAKGNLLLNHSCHILT